MTNNLTPLPNSSPVNPLIYRVNLRINLSFSTKSEPNSYFDYTDPKTRESSPKQIPIESSLQFQMSKAQDLSPARSAGWKGGGEPVSRANGVIPALTPFYRSATSIFSISHCIYAMTCLEIGQEPTTLGTAWSLHGGFCLLAVLQGQNELIDATKKTASQDLRGSCCHRGPLFLLACWHHGGSILESEWWPKVSSPVPNLAVPHKAVLGVGGSRTQALHAASIGLVQWGVFPWRWLSHGDFRFLGVYLILLIGNWKQDRPGERLLVKDGQGCISI